MSESRQIVLEQVQPRGLSSFARRLQEAFAVALAEQFGSSDALPSEADIVASATAEGAQAFDIVARGQRVGGAVVVIRQKTQKNTLELFFISPRQHGRGLGFAAWQAIEAAFPDTVVWETVTPYFEQRNLHFYINKCGFHAVEFFHRHHRDPAMPHAEGAACDPSQATEVYFRFEKVMKEKA